MINRLFQKLRELARLGTLEIGTQVTKRTADDLIRRGFAERDYCPGMDGGRPVNYQIIRITDAGQTALDTKRPLRIYVTQFGGWWSFSVAEWVAICKKYVEGNGPYDLPSANLLSRPPYHAIRIERGETQSGFLSLYCEPRPGHRCRVYEPCDQPDEWFREVIEELKGQ